jgi:hypothetical protein
MRFGPTVGSIGRPPTLEQRRYNLWLFLQLWTMVSAVLLLVLALFRQPNNVGAVEPKMAAIFCVVSLMVGFLLARVIFLVNGLDAAISFWFKAEGDKLIRLREWSDAYPEVRGHIAAINAQHRPIMNVDYVLIERYVKQLECDRR